MTALEGQTYSRDQEAADLTEKCGYAAAAVTLFPIPGIETLAVMPLHVGLVVRIGDLYGVTLDRDSASHLILRIGATVGLSLVGSRAASFVAKSILPGFGGFIAAPLMYASTVGIGRVAQAYFEHGGLSNDEMRTIYKKASKRARKGFNPARARSAEAREMAQNAQKTEGEASPEERLEKVKAMLDKGLISQDEYEKSKANILASI